MKKLYLNILAVFLAVYALLGFFVIPYYLQHNLSKILQKQLSMETYVGSIHFNPFSFEIKISDFILKDQKKKNLLFFETLYLNLEPSSLILGKIHLKHLKIHNLNADVDLDKNKTPNFQFLLQNSQSTNDKTNSQDKTTIPVFQVDKLEFSYLNFTFTDYSKKQTHKFETRPFNIELNNILIDTNNLNDIALKIATKHSGVLTVDSKFQVDPLLLNGKINLSQFNLNKVFNYLKPDDLSLNLDSKPLNLQFIYNLDISKEDLQLSLNDIELKLPQINITQDKYGVTLKELDTKVKKVDLLVAKDLAYNVTDINLKLAQIMFLDQNINTNLDFNNFNVNILGASSVKKDPIKFQVSLDTPLQGNLSLQGEGIQEPLQLSSNITLKNSTLKPYAPYLQQFANIDIKSFDLNTSSSLQVIQQKEETDIKLNGELGFKNIVLFNKKQNQELIKVKSIDFKKIALQNDFLNIQTIAIDKPFINFTNNQNGTNNFSNLVVVKEEQETSSENKQEQAKSSFDFLVKKVELKNGEASFDDKTITPNFHSKEEQINIQATNLSLDPKLKTNIIHNSVIDNYALLKAKGTLGLADPLNDLKVSLNLQNINLSALSSYSGKFIGNKIDKGKLSLHLEHSIQKGQLASTNNIKIQDIELGQKVASKDAIDAPIGLAIALLEDSSGLIDLDIPMTGDVKSPNFDISDAISDVIVNTIVGIVTAPFKFLALLTGLDGDADMSNVGFGYGVSTIAVTQKEKLDKIVEALIKRPQLNISIAPAYHFANDSKALQEQKFQQTYPLVVDTSKKFQELYSYIKENFIKIYTDKEYAKLEGEDDKKYPYMVAKLKETIKIDIKEVESLGLQRAKKVQDYLVSKGIDLNRISIQNDYITDKVDTKLNQIIVSFELESK